MFGILFFRKKKPFSFVPRKSNPVQMNQKLKIAVCTALFSAASSAFAQEVDSIPAALMDTLLQNEELPAVKMADLKKIDGEFVALEKEENGTFQLQDLEEARRYDSLWLKELHSNAALFSDMLLEIQNGPGQDSIFVVDLPTDTLKARLARMNEKTPFNISYNPSLESVIKSFLTRRRDLMQRMMTASQFYFPLFEQELDNQNIPLEIKYLAIIESALNPRAQSRVGAKGLWQFMYSTGKMYGLDVSSYVDERHDPIMATRRPANTCPNCMISLETGIWH